MEIWQAGHRNGYFYGLFPQFDWLQPFQKFPQFPSIVDRDKELRERADRTATMRYEVVTPVGYSVKQRYPLFMVLHAGNDTIEHARTYWRSSALSREYLVAYVQSARPMSSKSYGWRDGDPEMREGLRKLYGEIAAKYPVDTNRVLIGGMSAGGFMSMDVLLHNVLPVTGYVVNCPGVPGDFAPAMAEQVRQRGVRGVIITGEKDFGLARLKEMVEVFRKAGVPHRFTIIPGMGHEVPEDFPNRLDAALGELSERRAPR
jgi:predicted esterase